MKELLINRLILARSEFNENKHIELTRYKDNKKIENYINGIDFINYLPEKFNNMCSIYKTFFDGNKFYYDYEFEQLSDNKKIMIILNEIFNFIQGYYIYYDKNTEKDFLYIQNTTLLCIYHIGFICENVNYSLSIRQTLISDFNKWRNEKIEILKPNRLAAKYLFNLILNKDNCSIGKKKLKIESALVKCFVFYVYKLVISKSGLIFNINNKREFFIDKNNDEIILRNDEKVKEHKQVVKLIKSLSK